RHDGAPAPRFSPLFLGCLWRLRATVARAPRSPGGFREINTLVPSGFFIFHFSFLICFVFFIYFRKFAPV
ncbi:MAG: hypothetical protein K2G15_05430, partial [Muribaculaceae bacterium]|nr:hypothetical protein [Muribaculaceae bacterium]